MNKPLKSGLVFDANFEHPTCKGKSIITMCFRLLPDSFLCQNGKQVEIITKMIFELCYIEAIILIRLKGQKRERTPTFGGEPPFLAFIFIILTKHS